MIENDMKKKFMRLFYWLNDDATLELTYQYWICDSLYVDNKKARKIGFWKIDFWL